jgi:hypothetical protein
MSKLAICAAVMFALLALWLLARPLDLTILTFREPTGVIEIGSKFGVTVGATPEQARAALLSHGFGEAPAAFNSSVPQCGGRFVREGETLFAFADESWRKGMICVFVREDTVRAISWWFDPFVP